MFDLRIGQLDTHYRMPRRTLERRERLVHVLQLAFDDMLEHALERIGISPFEELCIRELHVPLRMRLVEPDHNLALTWSIALASSIQHAIQSGQTQWVVRYGSRVHALIDFTVGLARGDLSRAWAWRQLGFTSETALTGGTSNPWQQVLLRYPQAILPVLRSAAEQGMFPELARQLEDDRWLELAQAAVAAVGGNASRLRIDEQPLRMDRYDADEATSAVAEVRHQAAQKQVFAKLRAGLRRSPLARTMAEQLAAQHGEPKRRLAWAALACVDVAPTLLRGGDEMTDLHLRTATEILLAMSPSVRSSRAESSSMEAESPAEYVGDLRDAREETAIGRAGPDGPFPTESQRRPGDGTEAAGHSQRNSSASPEESLASRPPRRSTAFAQNDSLKSDETNLDPRQEAGNVSTTLGHVKPDVPVLQSLPLVRTRAPTEYGGLLFLLHVLEALKFPEQVQASSTFSDRLFPWVLHQLGKMLIHCRDDDPALLALVGLGPGGTHPSSDESRPTDDELRELASWLEKIGDYLRLCFCHDTRSGPSLVAWLCTRQAEVVADPGWIELHYSTDQADPAIRRVGLDLDPGFVPWLGVVMKFVYA
jgi:hypothetical protein